MLNFKAIPAVVSLSRLGIVIYHLTEEYLGTSLGLFSLFSWNYVIKIFLVLTGKKEEAIFFTKKIENWDHY